MKKLTIILFEDDLEFSKYSDCVFEKLSNLSKEKEFCGIWGEILFNNDEVLSTISSTVNYFINDTDKIEIIFGCCKKDYDDITSKINTEKCVIDEVSCQDLIV